MVKETKRSKNEQLGADESKEIVPNYSMLAAIVESSQDAIIGKDLDGIITSWNKGAEKIYGYSAKEAIGKPISVLVPPGRRDELPEIIQKIKKGEMIDHYETVRMTKEGKKIYVSLTISAIKDASGEIIGASTIARDITARRKVDEERLRLAAIVQSSQDAIVGKDLKGIITSWNQGAERVYGYAAEEAVDKSISILLPPGRRDELPEILSKIKKGETIDHYETVRMTKDGKNIHVSLTISAIKDASGEIIGASTIARDITARRKVDEERLRLAAIVESSEDAILGLTLDGVITSWNLGAEKMFGFHASDVIGHSVLGIYPVDRPDELQDIIKRIKSGQRIDHFETERKRKNGTIFDVSLSISAIRDSVGDVIGISKIIRDISGQKQASQYARSLIEASLDPLVTISTEGKITDVNEATVQVTGMPRKKLIDSDFSNYFIEPEKAREGYRQVLSKGKVTDYPLTIQHISGKTVDVLYNATVYRDKKRRRTRCIRCGS